MSLEAESGVEGPCFFRLGTPVAHTGVNTAVVSETLNIDYN